MENKTIRSALLAPSAVVLLVFFVAPLCIVAAYSFMVRGPYGGVLDRFTLENYQRLFDLLYGRILLRTCLMASCVTVTCLVLAFPLALFVARSGPRKHFYLQLIVLPFWTSFLIRTYAWMFLLRDSGLLNTVLLSIGAIQSPLPLLYNEGAVFVGLVYAHLPFAVLPLFSVLDRLDTSLLDAAEDLGARPSAMLLHVLLPLSFSGLRAAALLTFVPSFGAFLTPDLLGGGKSIMVGTLIGNQFAAARDWPFGSALALLVMIGITALVAYQRKEREANAI